VENPSSESEPRVKDPDFSTTTSDIETLWDSLLKNDTYDSITNQMLAMESYERQFKIQDSSSVSPITLVTMKDSTDYHKDSLLEKTIDRIIQLKLHKLTGMTLVELLDLPTYELKMIFRSVTKAGKVEKKKMDELEDELDL